MADLLFFQRLTSLRNGQEKYVQRLNNYGQARPGSLRRTNFDACLPAILREPWLSLLTIYDRP